MILLGLSGFIAIRLGYFPVALVNAWPVDEGDYNRAAEEIINSFDIEAEIPENNELRRLTLQKIIEDKLVLIEAKKYFSYKLTGKEKPSDIRDLIQSQISLLGSTFDVWLNKAKQRANVIILMSGYAWSGNEVLECKFIDKNSSKQSISVITNC